MNAYVDRAVRRHADLASLHVWAQMALRAVFLIVLLWALLTVALVWYWTGTTAAPTLISTSAAGFWHGFSRKKFR